MLKKGVVDGEKMRNEGKAKQGTKGKVERKQKNGRRKL